MWIYDASLALLLTQLVRIVQAQPAAQRPRWWPDVVEGLRIDAAYGDRYFDVGLDLGKPEQLELAALYDLAADQLRARRVVTPEQAATWIVLDDEPVIFRGNEAVDTEPTAQLSHALADLIRGTFPSAPSGQRRYYGVPDGPLTIPLRI